MIVYIKHYNVFIIFFIFFFLTEEIEIEKIYKLQGCMHVEISLSLLLMTVVFTKQGAEFF